MSGSKYETAMAQMENQETLNPDAHMFFNQSVEEQPMVVSTIIPYISLKEGLKQCGKKSRYLMKSEMRQLHLRNTFEPRHQSDLTSKEKVYFWSLICF